jgi:ABC-type transporter Mla MlaB component
MMFRMHHFDEPYSLRLRLEGVLAATAVCELEQSWNELVSRAQQRKLSVDASGVTRADDAGIAFLIGLQKTGVKIDDDGRFIPHDRRRPLERIRDGLCAVLCAIVPGFHNCSCEQRI